MAAAAVVPWRRRRRRIPPAGGFHPAAPAFNRTPSFSTPRAYAQPRYAAGAMHPGGDAGQSRRRASPGAWRGARPGLRAPAESVETRGSAHAAIGPNPYARGGNVNVNRTAFNQCATSTGTGDRAGIIRYLGYHQGWVHGYWNGHHPGGWGWRNGYGYPGYGYWGGYGGADWDMADSAGGSARAWVWAWAWGWAMD